MLKKILILSIFSSLSLLCTAQKINWTRDGNGYYTLTEGQIARFNLLTKQKDVLVSAEDLKPKNAQAPLAIKSFSFSDDNSKMLLFTNTQRVWRYETRGDYWIFDVKNKSLSQLGKNLPAATLMFAKLSPNGNSAAFVSEHNVYVEDLASHNIKKLTDTKGTKKLINGTFDWVYEEEFDCRDGFRWSPDSKKIAYWQIDANKVKDYFMLNTTDANYPKVNPVEYPVVGENPSPYKIGVVDIASAKTQWMNLPGDPENTYLPRMEWVLNSTELIMQQLNRKQNASKILIAKISSGETKTLYSETDAAWIDVKSRWNDGKMDGWEWLNGGAAFLWVSEKDGWRHVYKCSLDGKKETLLTSGDYDMITIDRIDDANGNLYFMASPNNATQQYLYRTNLDGTGKPEQLSPATEKGTHHYDISPNGQFAKHAFSNYYTPTATEWISMPKHVPLVEGKGIENKITENKPDPNKLSFFQVTTVDGVTMDGWLSKPTNFDSTKKYPIVFYVYTEPAGATALDNSEAGDNFLYQGSMADDGYIYASLDGRGTPLPKGAKWRKAIYQKIGIVNIRDQAMGATEMFKRFSWIDTARVAVWGWSGGGSTTLNCLFQYPDIYKTGIAVAAVADQLTYDNIYQERYMGIPQENKQAFIDGSPITYAKNLRGNLLYIHGTGDDNVHYKNAEELLNELIKYNKQFQFMSYPNRTHGIYEGEGTSLHLATLFTQYLKAHCAPGGR